MKKVIASLLLCILCFFIPIWVLSVVEKQEEEKENFKSEIIFPKDDVTVQVLFRDEVAEMSMHDYLVGTLAAEMPAGYPIEALKAQAVAARTNLFYKMWVRDNYPDKASHPEADICADFAHCQAFATEEEQREKWDGEYEVKRAKMERAVSETDGTYITYRNQPVSALFHAISSGRTEAASDVWGGEEIPYLMPVESGWDKDSDGYESVTTLTLEEAKAIVLEKYPEAVFGENPKEWIKSVKKSDSGGWMNLELCGIVLTGREFRNLFSLRSTHISLEWEGEHLYLTTHGYGHGVGMSQYGAKCLAEEGKYAEEILKYYYIGTTVKKAS